MSFLRRQSADKATLQTPVIAEPAAPAVGKGRPTPKRNAAQGARGPVAPPPKTQREAIKRSKTVGKTMTKDERRVMATERRERMMRGDDAYVLPRDKGKIRAYVRDMVDSRRNLAGLLLPLALLSFIILLVPVPVIQLYGPVVLLVAIAASAIDSIIFGRQLSRRVRAKFPSGDGSGLSSKGGALGFYAFNRACLIRRWRVPRARVKPGDRVD